MAKQIATKQPRDVATRFQGEVRHATESLVDFARQYARERPEVVALWAFGVGFVLGWKLKPW